MTNNGKWRGVSRRKKFKKEYMNEEESFDDNFKIGIAFNYSAKSKQS